VQHACNPSTSEAETGELQPGLHNETISTHLHTHTHTHTHIIAKNTVIELFSSRSFTVLGLNPQPLIHFDWFLHMVWNKYFFLCVDIQFSKIINWSDYSFLLCIFEIFVEKSIFQMCGFISGLWKSLPLSSCCAAFMPILLFWSQQL
jgi:hypothetical protein